MSFIERIAQRLGYIPTVKSTGWDKAWLRAIESQLTGNKVTKPYQQHWAVYLAISKIAINIAQTPFVLYRKDEPVLEHPVIDLFTRPNPQLSLFQLWEATAIFLNLKGECFWLLEESRGQAAGTSLLPANIWIFNPDRFKHALDADGNITGWVYRGRIPLSMDKVIHFKFFNPYDDLRGLAPLEASRITMETDYSAILYNRSFFKNSAEPSGVLKTAGALTDEQFKRLLAQWEARHRGESSAHRVAILEGGLDYDNVSLSHKDMAFLDQRKFSLEEILGVYGVPKSIALTGELRYATALVQRKAFWNDTLLPQMALIREKLAAEFFLRFAPDVTGRFDTDQIEELREDLKEKTETAKRLWGMGFTANEINDRLGMGFEKKPWRDRWWVPISLVPVDVAETPPEERSRTAADRGRTAEERKEKDARREAFRRRFLLRQQSLEGTFQSKIKRYFFEQRKRVLAILEGKKGAKDADEIISEIGLIWNGEEDRLSLMARPMYEAAVAAGGTLALDSLGQLIDFDLKKPEALEVLEARVNRIKEINQTLWRQLRSAIRDGFDAGETLDQIAERIRNLYNTAANRSKTIARTETAGCMNEASFREYASNGVQLKRWITAHDEKVRHTHMAAEAQGPILMTQAFSNGLKYPGDPEGGAGEVINCRCTIAPEVEV